MVPEREIANVWMLRISVDQQGTGHGATGYTAHLKNLISIKIETRDLFGRQGRLTIIKEFSKQMMHEPADLHIQLLDGLQ